MWIAEIMMNTLPSALVRWLYAKFVTDTNSPKPYTCTMNDAGFRETSLVHKHREHLKYLINTLQLNTMKHKHHILVDFVASNQ